MTDSQAIARIASALKDGINAMEMQPSIEGYPEQVRALAQSVVDLQKQAPSGDPDCPDVPDVPEE